MKIQFQMLMIDGKQRQQVSNKRGFMLEHDLACIHYVGFEPYHSTGLLAQGTYKNSYLTTLPLHTTHNCTPRTKQTPRVHFML